MSNPFGSHEHRALLAFVAEGFFSRLAFGILTFVVPLYALQQGMSLAAIGFLLSVNVIVSIALKPLMGAVADRIGYKRTLAAAIVMRSGVTLLFALAVSPLLLFMARGLHGVSIALRDPSLSALIAEHGGKKKVAQTFAWWQTAKSLAGNGSKIGGGLLLALTHADFQLVFLMAFVLSLLPIYVVMRYVHDAPRGMHMTVQLEELRELRERLAKHDLPGECEDTVEPLGRSKMASFAGLGFMVALTAYMVGPMFPIIMVEYAGLGTDQAGLIYGLSGLVAITAPVFGWLSDNVSNKLVLSLRSAANVGSSALYIAAPGLAGIAGARVVDDLGKAAFKPAWGKLMADVSALDKRKRARLMGYMSSGEDAGEALGPIVAGAIMSAWTIPAMFGIRIALAVVTELYTLVVTGTTRSRVVPPPRLRRVLRSPLAASALMGLTIGFGAGALVHETRPFAATEPPAAEARPR